MEAILLITVFRCPIVFCFYRKSRYPVRKRKTRAVIYSDSSDDDRSAPKKGGGVRRLANNLNAERCRRYRQSLKGEKLNRLVTVYIYIHNLSYLVLETG